MLKQHTGVTEVVTVHRYLTQLCTSLPGKKRYINPVLVYRWASVADDGSILNRHWINPLSAGDAFKRIHTVFPQLKFDRN